jgi:putative oxidoreductase
MSNLLGKYSEHIYALTRLVIGLLFACHGAQKLFGVLGSPREIGNPKFLTAGIIEFFGGLMIALGLAAGIAAFIASGEMAVAYFTNHVPRGFWPILNNGERAVLYCFFFLYVAAHGNGRFSLDAIFRRRSSPAEPENHAA